MPAHVKAGQKIGNDARPLTSVLQEGERNPGAEIVFARLDKGFTEVAENEGALVSFGEPDKGVRAPGLHTCAVVCFVNLDHADGKPVGYVYHANAGSVSQAKFGEIMTAIGGRRRYKDVYVAYAHQRNSDGGYNSTVANLRGWLNEGKLVQITNLFLNEFAMNGRFDIGY
jgi:hypothetical protein